MDDYFDVGIFRRVVSSESPAAQQWFSRGLVWCYSFAFEEAVRCFTNAGEADADCAMAYWGKAFALGPYYNKQWHKFDTVDLRNTLTACYDASQLMRPARHALGALLLERRADWQG
ncbi:MAG: hypothetical protein OEN20_04090 [Gammaproteobacteria bacterium]|nr:hypothetical protein [Gammaproteobacteria bacterium]